MENPEFLTIQELCARCQIGRSTAYRLIAEGGITCVRMGRRILVPRWALPGLERPEKRSSEARGGG